MEFKYNTSNKIYQIIVECSLTQKRRVKAALSHVTPLQKSAYILGLINKAIADKVTALALATDEPKETLRINCTKKLKSEIETYCSETLPKSSQSRWIIGVILDSQDSRNKQRDRSDPGHRSWKQKQS